MNKWKIIRNEEKEIIERLKKFEEITYRYRPYGDEMYQAQKELINELEKKYGCVINLSFGEIEIEW